MFKSIKKNWKCWIYNYYDQNNNSEPNNPNSNSWFPKSQFPPLSSLSSMESKRDTSKVPCKNFKAGNCRFGDKCNFSHEMCRFGDRCTNNACNYTHPRDLGIAPQPHKVNQLERPQFKPEQDRSQTKAMPRGPRPQGNPRGPWVPNNLAIKSQIAELPALLLGEATPEVKEEAVKKAAKHLKAVQKFLDEQTILLKRYSSAYEKMIEATMAASSTSEETPQDNPDEYDLENPEYGDVQEEDPVAWVHTLTTPWNEPCK